MAISRTVWGIDIGQCALKALKLRDVEGEMQVEAFDVVEHPKILSQPDADRPQLIRNALEQFIARNDVAGSTLAVAVPGQSTFTRFVKLPPVETKKIPDIVRFEAEQQIPFPFADVIWRWQTFQDPDSPDVECGIFAMKRVDVMEALDYFQELDLQVDVLQMAPLALYNFMDFDEQVADEGATLLVDIGADKTDLVVSDGARIWTRNIQIGGNNFTEALVRAFKLSFSKAEKLKRTAASSKYARQIFQAMRPVFADLVQEIQRSIGYYTSLHREARFQRLVGMGNGFRLPGLQKFLEQNLSIGVVRVDNFNRLTHSEAVNAPKFQENVPTFGVAYGLALQAMGQAEVDTNLLPGEIIRQRLLKKKRPWFVAAAVVLLAAAAAPLIRSHLDSKAIAEDPKLPAVQRELGEMDRLRDRYAKVRGKGDEEYALIRERAKLFGYHAVWPQIEAMLGEVIGTVTGDAQQLLEDYARARSEKDRQAVLEKLRRIPRNQRRILVVTKRPLAQYMADITRGGSVNQRLGQAGQADLGPSAPGYFILINAWTPMSELPAVESRMLDPLLKGWKQISEKYPGIEIRDVGRRLERAAAETPPPGAGPRVPDPLLPTEDMAGPRTLVQIGILISIEDAGNGPSLPEPNKETE